MELLLCLFSVLPACDGVVALLSLFSVLPACDGVVALLSLFSVLPACDGVVAVFAVAPSGLLQPCPSSAAH